MWGLDGLDGLEEEPFWIYMYMYMLMYIVQVSIIVRLVYVHMHISCLVRAKDTSKLIVLSCSQPAWGAYGIMVQCEQISVVLFTIAA